MAAGGQEDKEAYGRNTATVKGGHERPPRPQGDLGVAVRLGKMVVKNLDLYSTHYTDYFKGQPRTGEIVSTAAHRE
jgi:hypothetical protein